MSDDIVISVENVSKAYRIWDDPGARLKSPLLDGLARLLPTGSPSRNRLQAKAAAYYRDFYALKDISFQVRKGESVGIIGRNGSGKSTLLQIIAGTLQPTAGSVRVYGRVAALLELGSGFNPDFTGRENVYLNAAVLGLSRAETDAKFDSIAAFADIGDFLNQPVKTYSSGMMIRLAFAVAVSVEPEILIVDEALSVGDVFFQQKCFKRVHAMMEQGASLLFVSHDTAAVQNLCDRAILLKHGEQAFAGPPEEASCRYFAHATPVQATTASRIDHAPAPDHEQLRNIVAAYDMRGEARAAHGAGGLEIRRITVLNDTRIPVRSFPVGSRMIVLLELLAHENLANPNSGIHLFDRMNNLVFAAGTRQLAVPFSDFRSGETRLVAFTIELSVHPGPYTLSVSCGQASEDPNAGFNQHRFDGLGPITVRPKENGTWPFYGIAKLPMSIVVYG